jgi:hypothetical protein
MFCLAPHELSSVHHFAFLLRFSPFHVSCYRTAGRKTVLYSLLLSAPFINTGLSVPVTNTLTSEENYTRKSVNTEFAVNIFTHLLTELSSS